MIIAFSIVGIFRLEVENSFINYFNKDTEIYKGMKKIDDELGGTTPLNIILKFPSKVKETKIEDDEFDEWKKMLKTVKKINPNIGLLGIKWTKLSKFMII